MNVYVAGKTSDIERVRRVQALAREAGHIITFDWTVNVEREEAQDADISQTSEDRLTAYASADRKGVLDADTVVVLWHPRLFGSLIELGMAMSYTIYPREVWLVGFERDSVLFYLPHVHHVKWENLPRWFEVQPL